MKLSIVGGRADEKTGTWINGTKVDFIIISIAGTDLKIRETKGQILITNMMEKPLSIQRTRSDRIRILPGKQE